MHKKYRDFMKKYQNYLRSCNRHGIEIDFFNNDDSNQIKKENLPSIDIVSETKIENEIQQEITGCNNDFQLESAINYAFEKIVDENSNDQITIESLSLLHDVVYSLRRNTNVFCRIDVITSLIDLLYHPNLDIIMATLKLINVLTQGSRDPINLLIDNDLLLVLPDLIGEVSNQQEDDSIFHFIFLISANIAALSSKKVNLLVNLGYSNFLFQNINEKNINIQLAAAFLASNIMTKGLNDDIEKAINLSIIDHLFQFLNEDYEPHLFHCILDGIKNCLQNNVEIENILIEDIIKNEQYLEILYKLLSNDDEYTANLAQNIISIIEGQC